MCENTKYKIDILQSLSHYTSYASNHSNIHHRITSQQNADITAQVTAKKN